MRCWVALFICAVGCGSVSATNSDGAAGSSGGGAGGTAHGGGGKSGVAGVGGIGGSAGTTGAGGSAVSGVAGATGTGGSVTGTAGATGTGGTAGAAAASGGTAGTTGAAGATGGNGQAGAAGGAGSGADASCVQNTLTDCQRNGTAIVTAYVNCKSYASDPAWGPCGADGKISGGDYAGLPCPFDVGAEIYPPPTDPQATCESYGCAGQISCCGGADMFAWQDSADTIYCCNGVVVQKITRCR